MSWTTGHVLDLSPSPSNRRRDKLSRIWSRHPSRVGIRRFLFQYARASGNGGIRPTNVSQCRSQDASCWLASGGGRKVDLQSMDSSYRVRSRRSWHMRLLDSITVHRKSTSHVVKYGSKAHCQQDAHNVNTQLITASSYFVQGFLHARVDSKHSFIDLIHLFAADSENEKKVRL